MTNKNITLNVWKNNNGFAMAVQGEVNSRFLTIKLEDDNGPIDLTDKTVKFLARKPDGNVIFNDMIIDNAENGITVLELTSQMSAVPGILEGCEVHIISENGETLIAKKINIFIQESIGPAVEESISEINAYQKLINKLHELEVHSTNKNNPHNVTAAQVGALLDSTKYGTSLSVDGTTLSLKDQDGSLLNSIETQDTKYTAGSNVTISSSNIISATDTTYPVATEQTDGLMSSDDKSKVDGIESGAQANVQSDWNQTDTTSDDYIKNKPTIPLTLSSLSGVLPVSQGGTGVTTASAALINLGAMSSENPSGTGALSINRRNNTEIGLNSVAIGEANSATGQGNIAIGSNNSTTGNFVSIAIGRTNSTSGTYGAASIGLGNTSSGYGSLAIGGNNTSTGNRSVAIGGTSSSTAGDSIAIGTGLKASSTRQTVLGKYNIEDSSNQYAFILGGGSSDESRANFQTIDSSGNVVFAGTVKSAGLSDGTYTAGIPTMTQNCNLLTDSNECASLNTTNKTIIGAINELYSLISSM